MEIGHTLRRIEHIALMIRIGICCIICCIETQTVAPILPVFQGIKHFVQYLASHPHKLIFFPYNSYDVSNLGCVFRRNSVYSGMGLSLVVTRPFFDKKIRYTSLNLF